MPVPVSNVVKVTVEGDIGGSELYQQSWQFRNDSGVTLSDADALDSLEELLENLLNLVSALLSAVVYLRRFKVVNITTNTIIGERTFSAPIQGGNAGDPGDFTSAQVLSLGTSVPRVILRKSFGPVGEGAIGANGRLVGSMITAAGNVGDFLLVAQTYGAGTWRYGHFSPKTNSFVLPTGYSAGSAPGSVRRRKPGRGA